MEYWKIYCMERDWPGLWLRYYQHQVAAVGFPPKWGYKLNGNSKNSGWRRVRKALKEIQVEDKVVIQLNGNRVGRIGEVIRKEIEDSQWNPLVPQSRDYEYGEMGRQIILRWDLINAPSTPDIVVNLPQSARFTPGIVRPTICKIPKSSFTRIVSAVHDHKNWVKISPHAFSFEKSISDYIGSYPNRLEDGLQPYPSLKVRENVFSDGTRSDVLLIDRNNRPVIVECKQNTPTLADLKQLHGYIKKAHKVIGKKARGILVHGGPAKLPTTLRKQNNRYFNFEILRYSVDVDFSQSY